MTAPAAPSPASAAEIADEQIAYWRRTGIGRIQALVAAEYGLSLDAMLSPRRHRRIAWPRQIAYYLCRELTPYSLPQIARRFDQRHHTTIMHGIRHVAARATSDPNFAAELATLRQRAAQRLAARAE